MLAFFLTNLGINGQTPASNESIFWEISGNGLAKPAYLLGTYHVLPGDYMDNWPNVLQKLAQCEQLVVETIIDSAALPQMARHFVMPENSLDQLFSEEDYQKVKNAVGNKMGVPFENLRQIKPLSIMMTLMLAEIDSIQKLKGLKNYGGAPLDIALVNLYKEADKEVLTFETMEQQLNLLYGHYDVYKQAEMLLDMIADPEESFKNQEAMLQAYLNASLTDLMRLYVEANTEGEDFAFLLDDRNRAWMEVLPQMLHQKRTFIAVGAMHLPGEVGLIQLLTNAGYTLKPIQL